MRLYHVICITSDNKDISDSVDKEVKQFFEEKNAIGVSRNSFVYPITNMRGYKGNNKGNNATYLIYKIKIDENVISDIYKEIRSNVQNILVLSFILLTEKMENIPNNVI